MCLGCRHRCIRMCDHARLRLVERGVEPGDVERVICSPERLYYDVVARRLVYAGWLGGKRLLVVAEEEAGCFTVVTVIVTSGLRVEERRVRSGRWLCLHGC